MRPKAGVVQDWRPHEIAEMKVRRLQLVEYCLDSIVVWRAQTRDSLLHLVGGKDQAHDLREESVEQHAEVVVVEVLVRVHALEQEGSDGREGSRRRTEHETTVLNDHGERIDQAAE